MNVFAHFFINYFILSFFITNINEFIIPVIIFSIILDIDHIPGYIKEYKLRKKGIIYKENTNEHTLLVRTIIQEPFGILIFCTITLILFLLNITSAIITIIIISCFIMHWIVDFLTNNTIPLNPFNKKIINPFFKTKKSWLIKEFIITFVSAILFGLTYFVF